MHFFDFILVGSVVVHFLFSYVLLRYKKHPSHSYLALSFCMIGFWSITMAVFRFTTDPSILLYSMRASYVAVIGIAITFYFFVLQYMKKEVNPFAKWLHYLAMPVCAILILTPILVVNVYATPYGYAAKNGIIGSALFLLFYLSFFYKALITLMYARTTTTHNATRRKRIMILSMIIGNVIGMVTNCILPFMGNYEYIALGPIAAVITAIAMLYAVLRYRLLEIKILIHRSLLESLSVLVFGILSILTAYGIVHILLFNMLIADTNHLTTTIQMLLLLSVVINILMCFFVGLYSQYRKHLIRYYAMMSSIILWQITNYLISYFPFERESAYSIILKTAYAIASFLAASAVYFFLTFPQNERQKIALYILFIISTLLAATSYTDSFIYVFQFDPLMNIRFWTTGTLYPIYLAALCIAMISIVFVTLRNYRHEKNHLLKRQMKPLLLGICLFGCTGIFMNIILPYIVGEAFNHSMYQPPYIQNVGPISTLFLTTSVSYGILRHRLLYTKVLLKRRTIIHSLVFLALLTPTMLIVALQFGELSMRLLFISICLAGMLFFFSYPLAKKIPPTFIKRQIIDLYKLGPEEKAVLETCQKPSELMRQLHAYALKRIPVVECSVVAYQHYSLFYHTIYPTQHSSTFNMEETWVRYLDTHRELMTDIPPALEPIANHFNAELILPLHDGERVLGAFFFGKKINQEDYTEDDLIFLKNFQKEATRTLWNVLQLEHVSLSHIDNADSVQRVLQKQTQ